MDQLSSLFFFLKLFGREAWCVAVHGVRKKSQTGLRDRTTSTLLLLLLFNH